MAVMSIDTVAVAYGSLPVHLSLEMLREYLSSQGLTPSVADVHVVRVKECPQFVFQEDGKGSYLVSAKGERLEELLRDTALVSRALSEVPLEHTVEVYDSEDRLVRIFAYPPAVSSDLEFAPTAVSHPISDT
jgi:hypothetical protein